MANSCSRNKLSTILAFILSVCLVLPVAAQSSLQVIIHTVDVSPRSGELTYDVNLLVSVIDSLGNPVEQFQPSNFKIVEDGREITDLNAALSRDEPINVILVLDTSGSMSGTKMTRAKEAAAAFVSGLQPGDQVAVFSFDDDVQRRNELTGDFSFVINQINEIESTPSGGTCLYDAAFQAAEFASTLPSGRRAIVLLTDGKDETAAGGVCSTRTIDEVTRLTSNPAARVPIYAIGLGNEIDEQALRRLSLDNGGRYAGAPNADALASLFQQLARQLNTVISLSYISSSAPGTRRIVVQSVFNNTSDEDSIEVSFPGLPPEIRIAAPNTDAEVGAEVNIAATILERGIRVNQVKFEINGVGIHTANEPPYEITWNLGTDYGDKEITVSAYDAGGQLLSSESVAVSYPDPAGPTPTTQSDDGGSDDGGSDTGWQLTSEQWYLIAGIGGGLLLLTLLLVGLSRRKKKSDPKGSGPEKSWLEDATIDGVMLSSAAATLVVTGSDDASRVGERLNILKLPAKIGRSAENDFVFPKDTPVSRLHAQIEEKDGRLVLREVVQSMQGGVRKRPTYGTFVNNEQVDELVTLNNGDEIRLGKRLAFRFEEEGRAGSSSSMSDDATFDGIELNPTRPTDDATLD